MMQDSDTIEIEIGVLRKLDPPGWGETKMQLLEKARQDINDAAAVLKSLQEPAKFDCFRSQIDRIVGMALDKLSKAKSRVDICHNELDCERGGLQPVTRD